MKNEDFLDTHVRLEGADYRKILALHDLDGDSFAQLVREGVRVLYKAKIESTDRPTTEP